MSNLISMVDLAPASEREGLYQRVGDARTPDGRQLLRDRSPVFRASQIDSPLLLAVGARDPRSPRTDADQIAQGVRTRRGNLTYLVFPDEGADLARPQNRLSYLAVLEHFLGDCLGGRVEPVGASFEGANINVFDGAVNVPGLSAFARRQAAPRAAQPPVEAPDTGAAAEDVHLEPVDPAPPLNTP
jgi:hypothetical protein